MKYKAILFDLDNTLYDYKPAHTFALEESLQFVYSKTKIPIADLSKSYDRNRKNIHNLLHGLGSSHSRLLYFQRVLEQFNLGYLDLLEIHKFYWDRFLDKMVLLEGVEDLFQEYSQKCKFGIVTDLTAEIQFQKLARLKLLEKISAIVTSEESGKEKPHPYAFHLALEKIQFAKEDVVYIGDDFEKDVIGSTSFGMDCIWLNRSGKNHSIPERCREVNEFKKIIELLK